MEQIRVGQVDLSSGELMEGAALALIFPKRRNGFHEGWVAMAQSAMERLAMANLGNEASRVLWLLLARLDFENWIHINQAELARHLEIQRPNFGRALRKLVAEGVVLEGPKVGRNGTYRLSPSYGWKGSAKGHNEALQERMRARGLSVVRNDEPIDDRTLPLFSE